MARRVFYSFEYKADAWRAAMVRNIGAIEGNKPASDNDWETVTKGKDPAIERWIAAQMNGRTCTVVLVGASTANRKWINYEISKSWAARMGVVGIRVHGLETPQGFAASGQNPFDYIPYSSTRVRFAPAHLSSIVKCYDPGGSNGKERYAWIVEHLANAVDEAIRIRNEN